MQDILKEQVIHSFYLNPFEGYPKKKTNSETAEQATVLLRQDRGNGGFGQCKKSPLPPGKHTPNAHTYSPLTHLQPGFVISGFSDDAWEIITFTSFVISKMS